MPEKQLRILYNLREEGPDVWLSYVLRAEQRTEKPVLNMDIVFQRAATLAKELESLEWAEVAIRAAEVEAAHCVGSTREDALLKAMRHRSWFIAKMGSRPDHFVLNKAIVLGWAEQGMTLSLSIATAKAIPFWESFSNAKSSSNPAAMKSAVADLKQLRHMKHKLSVVKVLADCGELPSDSVLNDWLKLREQLP